MRWEGEDPRVSGLHTEEQTHGTEGLCVCVFTRGRDRERDREKGTLELRESAEAT